MIWLMPFTTESKTPPFTGPSLSRAFDIALPKTSAKTPSQKFPPLSFSPQLLLLIFIPLCLSVRTIPQPVAIGVLPEKKALEGPDRSQVHSHKVLRTRAVKA